MIFRLRRSLDLLVAPILMPRHRMARPFTPRNPRLVACPEMWHHYVFDRAINTTGLSPAGSQNCRLLHLGGTRYRAKSWDCARRVVAKVEWHAGELFPRIGFVVTNLRRPPKRVIKFYNGRGTAEQWIKEGKNAVKWTKLSCRRFKDNETRLHLFALAYNLGNFLRQLVLPKPIQGWTLTTLREKLIKIGAKVVAHAKYLTFQLAEVAIPRKLFARILERIARLCPACAWG